jgi:hypothetical protein
MHTVLNVEVISALLMKLTDRTDIACARSPSFVRYWHQAKGVLDIICFDFQIIMLQTCRNNKKKKKLKSFVRNIGYTCELCFRRV